MAAYAIVDLKNTSLSGTSATVKGVHAAIGNAACPIRLEGINFGGTKYIIARIANVCKHYFKFCNEIAFFANTSDSCYIFLDFYGCLADNISNNVFVHGNRTDTVCETEYLIGKEDWFIMKRKQNGVKQTSLFSRIILPFVALVIVIGVLLVGLLAAFGTFQQIHEDELHMLSEVTVHQAAGVVTGVDQQHTVGTFVEEAQANIAKWLFMEKHTFAEVQNDYQLCTEMLNNVAPIIKEHLNRTHLSGVFIVLDSSFVNESGESMYAGIYLREKQLEWLEKKSLLLRTLIVTRILPFPTMNWHF